MPCAQQAVRVCNCPTFLQGGSLKRLGGGRPVRPRGRAPARGAEALVLFWAAAGGLLLGTSGTLRRTSERPGPGRRKELS